MQGNVTTLGQLHELRVSQGDPQGLDLAHLEGPIACGGKGVVEVPGKGFHGVRRDRRKERIRLSFGLLPCQPADGIEPPGQDGPVGGRRSETLSESAPASWRLAAIHEVHQGASRSRGAEDLEILPGLGVGVHGPSDSGKKDAYAGAMRQLGRSLHQM